MALKVLTVDDSKTIRAIVKKAFRPFDCEIMEAENGVEGLATANREKPDLIVLDITMPVMNGIEMLEKLKADAVMKTIPVIMLTAESGKDNVLQIVKMGVKDYMVKPFKGEELIERAHNLVKLAPKKEEAPPEEKTASVFLPKANLLRLFLPNKITKDLMIKISNDLQPQIDKMPDAGMNVFIIDLSKSPEVSIALIKLVVSARQSCRQSNIRFGIVGNSNINEQFKKFHETGDIQIYPSVDEAKAA